MTFPHYKRVYAFFIIKHAIPVLMFSPRVILVMEIFDFIASKRALLQPHSSRSVEGSRGHGSTTSDRKSCQTKHAVAATRRQKNVEQPEIASSLPTTAVENTPAIENTPTVDDL